MASLTVMGLFAALALVLPCSALTDEEKDQLREFVQDIMSCRHNVGASVTLVRKNETVLAEGFGYRDLEAELPLESNTLINIASVSKAFTATLVADVVGRDLADWDTPLKEILGDDFELQDDFRTEQASFRDLLAHKLALPNYWGLSTAAMNFTREELVWRMRHFPVRYNFRQQYVYANYPWVLAGWATEALTGMTWEEHMREAIFDPLGMDDSRVSNEMTSEDWANAAYSYSYVDDVYHRHDEQGQITFLDRIGPSAAVWTTAEDIGKWMRFHLNDGRNDAGDQIVPAASLAETYRGKNGVTRDNPHIRMPRFPVLDIRSSYGYGWYDGIYRGYEKTYHTGSYSGYNCRLSLLQEMDIGAWACFNSPGTSDSVRAARLVTMFALDLLLGEEPWLNGTTGCSFPDPWNVLGDDEEVDLEDEKRDTEYKVYPVYTRKLDFLSSSSEFQTEQFEGIYEHPGFGNFTVYANDSDGSLRYSFGLLLKGPLVDPEGEYTYHMWLEPPLDYRHNYLRQYPRGIPVNFLTDGNDTVVAVEVPYLEFSMPPVFTKVD